MHDAHEIFVSSKKEEIMDEIHGHEAWYEC